MSSGEVSNDPSNSCHSCQCLQGTVTCYPSKCPISSCSHPSISVCGCPICDQCNYNGITYNNNQVSCTAVVAVWFYKFYDLLFSTIFMTYWLLQFSWHANFYNFFPFQYCSKCRQISFVQEFVSPFDACLSCSCRDGNVNCVQKACNFPPRCEIGDKSCRSCQYPVLDSCGCASCASGCMIGGQVGKSSDD